MTTTTTKEFSHGSGGTVPIATEHRFRSAQPAPPPDKWKNPEKQNIINGMLEHVDILLLQEVGEWDSNLSEETMAA